MKKDKRQIFSKDNGIIEMFDTLDMGLKVFRGTPDGNMEPVFYNTRAGQLLGLTEENFQQKLGRENKFCVHPDDLAVLDMMLLDALETHTGFSHSHRMISKDGEYFWVTMHATFRFLDDGDFLMYNFFGPDESVSQIRTMNEMRHQAFMDSEMIARAHNLATVHFTLPEGRITYFQNAIKFAHTLDTTGSAYDLARSFVENIEREDIRDEVLETLRLPNVLEGFKAERFDYDIDVPCQLENGSFLWLGMQVRFHVNPTNGVAEGFVTFINRDNELRIQHTMAELISQDYVFLAQIDTESEITTVLDTKSINRGSARYVPYRKAYEQYIRGIVCPEIADEAVRTLNLDNIKLMLENDDTFMRVYPCLTEKGEDVLIQWRMRYLESHPRVIYLTAINVTKHLGDLYDPLTGLYNRKGFCKLASQVLKANPDKKYRIIRADFDNFKLLNEEQGFSGGNRFLRQFAADISSRFERHNKPELLAHFDADHFLSLREQNGSIEDIYNEITTQLQNYPEAYRLTVRMGVYDIEDIDEDVELMCDGSLLALKSAKNSGTQPYVIYTPTLRDKLLDERVLSQEMHTALKERQFDVWFQPQVNHPQGGALIGAEALVRWNHPERGMISPAVFIPLFEQTGFIYELDKYMWERVCEYLRNWLNAGLDPVPVSVNISRLDVIQEDFLPTIFGLVERYHIPKKLLHLEITESAFTEHTNTVVTITNKLIDAGFVIAIDDFGSGYSSLSLLRNVPANILKLDMRFFDGKGNVLRNECIIESIVRMAKMLGMAVLAEGVEVAKQADFLSSVGCNYIQGFMYSKALPCDQYLEFAEKNKHGKMTPAQETKKVESELPTDGDELFRSIISKTNMLIMVADYHTHDLLYANSEAESYYGKSFDPMKPTTCYEFRNRPGKCEFCPIGDLALGDSEDIEVEENGRMFAVRHSHIYWNGHDAIVTYQSDITEASAEREKDARVLRNIPGALVVFTEDENGIIRRTFSSSRARDFLGPTTANIDSPTLEECVSSVHPDDRERLTNAIESAYSKKTSFQEDFRLLGWDGKYFWAEMTVNSVQEEGGKYVWYGIFVNVNSRHAAQEYAEKLIQNLPCAMTVYADDGKGSIEHVYLSPQAQALIGSSTKTRRDVPLNELWETMHPDDVEHMNAFAQKIMRTKGTGSEQYRLIGPKGEVTWVELNITPIQDNHRWFYYGVFTNITAFKEIQHIEKERQERLIGVYQQMVGDTAVAQTDDLLYKVHLDWTDQSVVSFWANEKEIDENEVTQNVIATLCLSPLMEKDREMLKKELNKDTLLRAVRNDGYCKKSFEFIRETLSGRACWVRVDVKMFLIPATQHITFLLFCYDIGSKTMPPIMMRDVASPDIELVYIINSKTGVVQGYDLRTKDRTSSVMYKSVAEMIIGFADRHIPQIQQKDFLDAHRLKSIAKNLKTTDSVYRITTEVMYQGESRYKTWEYHYIDPHKQVLLVTRYDSTKELAAEQKDNYHRLLEQVNQGLHDALNMDTPDDTLNHTLSFLGSTFGVSRSYIFEKNVDGRDDNTYEWVADGVEAMKEHLQAVSNEITAHWYDQFNEHKTIVLQNIEDIRDVEPNLYWALAPQGITSLVVAPFFDTDGHAIGFLGLDNPPLNKIKTITQIIQTVAYFVEAAIKRRGLVRELLKLSYYDQLTGLGNRHALVRFKEQSKGAATMGSIFCDMNGLKRVNDQCGHEEGDRQLVLLADCLRAVMGEEGHLFRMGGDELLVLCPDCDQEYLNRKEQELRDAFAAQSLVVGVGNYFEPQYKGSLDTVVSNAEHVMYEDKSAFYKKTGIDPNKR